MVRPASFGLNEQTAVNNFYQDRSLAVHAEQAATQALKEFDTMVHTLERTGIEVHVLHDTPEPYTPDSIFPNNWFRTDERGTLTLFPMCAPNRRAERRSDLSAFLRSIGFAVHQTHDLSGEEQHERYLEGTGSLVFDHLQRTVYAALSERTHPALAREYAASIGYTPHLFTAYHNTASGRHLIYHTNVMLSIGTSWCAVCAESIDHHQERAAVLASLRDSGREVIALTEAECDQFAGNMLELRTAKGDACIVLSQRAWGALRSEVQSALERHAHVVAVELHTIERLGGGSARCMMAELFLPRSNAPFGT
jgi:hypothetical protein